jgi:hypothetical protein
MRLFVNIYRFAAKLSNTNLRSLRLFFVFRFKIYDVVVYLDPVRSHLILLNTKLTEILIKFLSV